MNLDPIYHITFLRHGESVGNAEQRYQGQADFPLTERGRAQAQALAGRWQFTERKYDLCLASPLLRARQTAEIVAGTLSVPIEFQDDWMELHNGRLAGLTDDEAQKITHRPEYMTPYDHYGETGESRMELLLRAGRAVQKLLDRPPARYLIVSHGGILNMALYVIFGISLHANGSGPRFIFDNTAYADFTYTPDSHSWRLWEFVSPQIVP